MTWLALWFALEAGLMNPQLNIGLPLSEQQYYIEFATRMYVAEHVYVGGSVETRFIPDDGDVIQFCPYSSVYWFEAGVEFKHFEIGFRHYCQHPSLIYGSVPLRDYEGGYEQLFIRVDGTVPLVRGRSGK